MTVVMVDPFVEPATAPSATLVANGLPPTRYVYVSVRPVG